MPTNPADTREVSTDRHRSAVRTYIGVILALGLWAVVSAVVFEGPAAEVVDDVFVALVFLTLAASNYYLYRRHNRHWLDGPRIAVVIGLWLVAFSLHVGTGGVLMTDSLLLGLAAAILNGYFYWRLRRHERGF